MTGSSSRKCAIPAAKWGTAGAPSVYYISIIRLNFQEQQCTNYETFHHQAKSLIFKALPLCPLLEHGYLIYPRHSNHVLCVVPINVHTNHSPYTGPLCGGRHISTSSNMTRSNHNGRQTWKKEGESTVKTTMCSFLFFICLSTSFGIAPVGPRRNW